MLVKATEQMQLNENQKLYWEEAFIRLVGKRPALIW